MAKKNEEDWDARFGPTVQTADDATMWQPGDHGLAEAMTSQPLNVWSVIEGDDETQYLSPGARVVNVIGYVIAAVAITTEELASDEWGEVLWFDPSQVVCLNRP